MKRKLILLVVTIVFLVGFGVILHSPPSMIDAVTGATPKSKKAAQASAQLEGSYVLGIKAGIYEKMEYDFVCFNASHFYDSWNHGQLYAERSWK